MQSLVTKLEEFIRKTKGYLIEAVEKMLTQELPVLTEEKFALFEATGNRLLYEQDYFAKRKFLTVFGVAAQWMEQEQLEAWGGVSRQEVLKKLEEILVSICKEECWALPAHVNRKEDASWRECIDLFAAETAQSLADIVDAVGKDLSSQCCGMVRANVKGRVLQPFFQTPINTYDWEQAEHNWNAVCNGCIGSAYLHSLAKEEVPNPQYRKRITENLLYYIKGFAEDGTCMEGLGYYSYGMTYLVNLANELYEETNGEIDLLCGDWGSFQAGAEDKRTQIAQWWSRCFFASGRTVSFSDGDSRDKYRMGLACALAERFPEVELADIKCAATLEEDACYRYLPFKMDVFCTKQYLKLLQKQQEERLQGTEVPNEPITILKAAQWCIGQATLTDVGFACKGGHNDEPHNHNDVGSFLYVAGKDMFLADLGAGEYTKDYFGVGRYNILCNRSLGHNVPLIAGCEQLTGLVYKCNAFEAGETASELNVHMDLTNAYKVDALKQFLRKIIFDKENGALVIEDIFESMEEITITENLVTQYSPEIEGNSIILIGKEGICHIQITTPKKKTKDFLRIIPMEHSNHKGEQEQVYLIQWDSVVKGGHKERFQIERI